MTRVMAVTFEPHGQLHYLRADEGVHRVGDKVLYPTDAGPEVVQVVWAAEDSDEAGAERFPVCAGAASAADVERDTRQRTARAEATAVAKRLIGEAGLPMKVVGVDVTGIDRPGGTEVAVYYTAPERVDFRALVGQLARSLRARIDLRQVGDRDAAALTGGIGSCGRELCCSTWLKDLEPVGLRLARDQGLPANPLLISGACGRLMCCLKYGHPLYEDFARRAPAIGASVEVTSSDAHAARGTVVGHRPLEDAVLVRSGDGRVEPCPLASVCSSSRRRKERSASRERRAAQIDQPPHQPEQP